jgi:protein-tyrosine-phosphatase
MAEVGIDITGEFPKPWTDEIVRAADVVVTMGCGDACPLFPGKRYEDWILADPFGKSVEEVRPTRDEIGRRVRELLTSLGVEPRPS